MADASVLVIEDDPALAEVVVTVLEGLTYRVDLATTGRDGLETASAREPDVIVLDLGLPDIDGLEVCRHLRQWFRNPIVVLSADGAEDRKIDALDLGADDYVTKPFSMPELLARLRVALRHRRAASAVVDDVVLRVGDLTIDVGAHAATLGDDEVVFTRKEFALLVLLARNPGRVLTHRNLLEHVWGRTDGAANLRVHISQLREKLGTGPSRPSIVTEPGVGYRLLLESGNG